VSDRYLEIQGLKKSFGLKPVLRGIDLTLGHGERMALMGANGAGKTTLLRILAALTKPGSGSVIIDGLNVERDAQQIRRLVGFVAHQPYLYDELSAMENLLFFGKMYSVKDAQARSQQLLRRVGLEKRAADRVGTFSRGMVQRLSLARALLHNPQLLLLDEPDTGLDQEGVQIVTDLLDEHTRHGGTALFTTHQPERALTLTHNIITLRGGRIIDRKAGGEETSRGGSGRGRGDGALALPAVAQHANMNPNHQGANAGGASAPSPQPLLDGDPKTVMAIGIARKESI
jgi:heme exporter protein A